MKKAQNRMKKNDDQHRSERSFDQGDWVYLKLQPYRQVTVGGMRNKKLSSKYYGPFEILKRVGTVAYQLNLPPGSLIHPVFHVSQLKAKVGNAHIPSPTLLIGIPCPDLEKEPQLILGRRMVKRRNAAQMQLLVQWKNQSQDDATWEDYEEIAQQFTIFIREDTNFLKEGELQREIGDLGMTVEEDEFRK